MKRGRRGGWYTSTNLSLTTATPMEERGGLEGAGPGSPDIRLSPSSAATSKQGKDYVCNIHWLKKFC